ncbi:hypothetical protein P7C73_g1187, partial [Tremellales sp. Uapishka_1]
MVLHGYSTTSAKLANGEIVAQNDHVYVSPPWSDRDGTPYIVARIIEFLPPLATPRKGSRRPPSTELQVRLSLFYRPSDISGRNISDFRMLIAAIHTDTQSLSSVRGKCYVRHKDRIENLLAWKKLPDHFYYVKYYDPYIKREYEMLRTENVNNIPPDVKKVLVSRYEYLIAEKEMVSDLLDTFRICCICDEWASSQESVKCERVHSSSACLSCIADQLPRSCKKHYHMSCLQPPLSAKPAKGYSWVCIPCSLQRVLDVKQKKFYHQANPITIKVVKNGTATAKGKETASALSNRPDVTYQGWPWRYFGLYTAVRDTIDKDDLIFPKAATRVGTKFQALVPEWDEQQAVEATRAMKEGEAGPSRHTIVERGYDPGSAKHDDTIVVLSEPNDDLESYMAEVATYKLAVPPYDVRRLDKAIQLFHSLGRAEALQKMQSLRRSDFSPNIHFDERETATFESELERIGGLDAHETGKILNKRSSDVLRFSYIWKNKKLKVENEALRQHHKVTSAHARTGKTLGAPSLGKIRGREGSAVSDDEVSLYSAGFVKENKMQCAACHTRMSGVWWRSPRTVSGKAMCETCGSNYRKYGFISSIKAEDSKRTDKKDEKAGTKKGKADSNGTSTPVPPPPPRLPPCACCKRMEPKASMARCKSCTFSVHSGCYGIASPDMGPDWECELCTNVKSLDYNFDPKCVLCPRDANTLITKSRSKKSAGDFDILSALKPTEGLRWAHVLCSAWIPELLYTNPGTFKKVEGIAILPLERWEGTCALCQQSDGAVITCSDCEMTFHPSCAWMSGFKFGFEFSLAKPGKREAVTIAKFKEEAGVMNSGCWCKSHDLEGRTIYEMHEMDTEQNETALQIYTASYKTLPFGEESFALLRKATKLDQIIPPHSIKEDAVEKSCAKCQVDVSPKWHQVDNDNLMEVDGEVKITGKKIVCHQCWFDYSA